MRARETPVLRGGGAHDGQRPGAAGTLLIGAQILEAGGEKCSGSPAAPGLLLWTSRRFRPHRRRERRRQWRVSRVMIPRALVRAAIRRPIRWPTMTTGP